MNRRCLIISFDFTKPGYPPISYSIASILAKFKNTDIEIEPYAYDLKKFLDTSTPKEEIEKTVIKRFQEKYLEKVNDYAFIIFAAYSWSENLVQVLTKLIRLKFKGEIILGGYEITALSEEKLLEVYPNVDYYVKGYAEKALEMIFNGEAKAKILNEKIETDDMISPYLSGVLPLNTKKIYWESKRGCPFACDFCEHGAASLDRGVKKSITRISSDRLDKEIALFKANNVKEINVLDPTFLITDEDNTTLEKLLKIPKCNICLQMHFSTITKSEKGERFLEICRKNRDRVSLEFGLQTIHDEEMKILYRKNYMYRVKTVMKRLNEAEIKYSISIIYGIPSQTVASFRETIEFIKANECERFCAYPLQLPKNSKMRERMDELKIKEFSGEHFSSRFVCSSFSFDHSEWKKMYDLAASHSDSPPFIGDPSQSFLSPSSPEFLSHYFHSGIVCRLRPSNPRVSRSIFHS